MAITRKVTIQQAIEVAQANKKLLFTKNVNEDLNDVVQFVLALEIKAGKIPVPSSIIYDAYLQWSGDPTEKRRFFVELNKLLVPIKSSSKIIYLLNYQPPELLREASQ